MAERKTYAVFLPDKRWGRTNSLATTKKAIDDAGGGTILSVPYNSGRGGWDAPTFRAVGDLVAYTPKKKRKTAAPRRKTTRRK